MFVFGPELQELFHFRPIVVQNFMETVFTTAEEAEYKKFLARKSGDVMWIKIHFGSNDWLKANGGIFLNIDPSSFFLLMILTFVFQSLLLV